MNAVADITDALILPLTLGLFAVGSIVWIVAELRAPSRRWTGIKLAGSAPMLFVVLVNVKLLARGPLGSDTPPELMVLSLGAIALGAAMLVWLARLRPKADIDS